jgi:cell shape-determining protein MreD
MLVIMTAMAVAIQTSLLSIWPISYVQPDLILLVVLWAALRRRFIEGGVLTLIFANISETHSGAPQGIHLMTYMCIYLIVRVAAKVLVISGLSSYALITGISSMVWKLAGLGIMYLLGKSGNQWRHTLMYLIPSALIEGTISLWIYRWLEKFDFATFKAIRSEQGLPSSGGISSFEEDFAFEGEGR